nr:crooked neck-like protein 1 [Tanacetum cinerariifolium]
MNSELAMKVWKHSLCKLVIGNAIVFAPKDKKYIEIKLQLGNMDRCTKLYEKSLQCSLENCYAWRMYTELERSLMETERARAIFELAIAQPALDMPELLWKEAKKGMAGARKVNTKPLEEKATYGEMFIYAD